MTLKTKTAQKEYRSINAFFLAAIAPAFPLWSERMVYAYLSSHKEEVFNVVVHSRSPLG